METTIDIMAAPSTYALTRAEIVEEAERVAKSSLCPPDYQNKPNDILIAWQLGAEVGLQPLQALRSIMVTNKRPSLLGIAMLALIRGSDVCEYLIRDWDEEGQKAVITCKRTDETREHVESYSWEDARLAGLTEDELYEKHPKDMLTWKCISRVGKVIFPDVIGGLHVSEEVRDYPDQSDTSAGVDSINERLRKAKEAREAPKAEYAEATISPVVDTDDPIQVLLKLFRDNGMRNMASMGTMCGLILDRPNVSMDRIIDVDADRIVRAVELIIDLVGPSNFVEFASYVSLRIMTINNPGRVKKAVAAFKDYKEAKGRSAVG